MKPFQSKEHLCPWLQTPKNLAFLPPSYYTRNLWGVCIWPWWERCGDMPTYGSTLGPGADGWTKYCLSSKYITLVEALYSEWQLSNNFWLQMKNNIFDIGSNWHQSTEFALAATCATWPFVLQDWLWYEILWDKRSVMFNCCGHTVTTRLVLPSWKVQSFWHWKANTIEQSTKKTIRFSETCINFCISLKDYKLCNRRDLLCRPSH